ncbi:MAG: RNA-binding protein [Acidobacteria bacterium]|nr:RNA-binding protein [Acidobacteriota bacterium]MBI3656716.1 RNA-binding protein [Acidobacteriota bacterium]
MANTKLYVGNLAYGTSQEDLEELFGKHGQVAEVRIIRDMNSGQSRGFAFVEMASPDDAQKAMEALNGFELQDRALVVNEARPKEGRPRGGGGGAGGGRGDRRGGRDRGDRGDRW